MTIVTIQRHNYLSHNSNCPFQQSYLVDMILFVPRSKSLYCNCAALSLLIYWSCLFHSSDLVLRLCWDWLIISFLISHLISPLPLYLALVKPSPYWPPMWWFTLVFIDKYDFNCTFLQMREFLLLLWNYDGVIIRLL